MNLCQYNDYVSQRETKRSFFLAWSTEQIAKSMMLDETEADLIYCKEIDQGVLYAITYDAKNQKLHTTVDNYISSIDEILKALMNKEASFFVPINDDKDSKSSKVLSFEKSGNPKKGNRFYRKIFDVKGCVLPGVTVWKKTLTESFDFDVVKKRRAMDAVSPTPAADDDPDALSEFEDFERNVLPALEAILEDERNNQRKELEEFEENNSKGIYTTTGGVYFAWSSCLKCMKIGATRRDDPAIRLRELSRHVTTPFVLMGWIPTPTPFRRESVAHRHFVSKRIRNAGAGTEFFHIGREEAEAYCGGGGV